MADAAQESTLSLAPTDGISSIAFTNDAARPSLLVSSWDAGVSLYDVERNKLQVRSATEALSPFH